MCGSREATHREAVWKLQSLNPGTFYKDCQMSTFNKAKSESIISNHNVAQTVQ